MIGHYADMLAKTAEIARRLGFTPAVDEDFYAEFLRNDGWAIGLEGDRLSYPAFTLWIARDGADGKTMYAVWILMTVFLPRIPPVRHVPTLDNQLWFLEAFAPILFDQEESYRDAYIARNGGA